MLAHVSSSQASTAIGSYLLHIVTGITTIWGSTNIYYLSYFHYQDQSINADTNSIILISVIIPLSIALVLSNKVCEKVGFRKTIQLCSAVFFISQMFIYIKFSLLFFIVFSLIIPVCCISISLTPTLNLLWSHFLEKKSICTAVNLVFLGLGTILWNFLFLSLVNPKNEEAEIDSNGNSYFSINVASKIQNATKIVMFICSLIFLIGAHLIKDSDVPSEENNHMHAEIQTKQKKNKQEQQEVEHKQKLTCQRSIAQNNKPSEEMIDQVKKSQNIQTASIINGQKSLTLVSVLKDQRCWLIFVLLIVIDVYPIYLLTNFKVIFMPVFNDDHFLVVCLTINTIANILGTILWGFLAHKLGNITAVSIVVSCTLLGGILGFFSQNHFVIIVFIIIFGIGDRGMETIAGPALVEIFGLRTATLLLPYKGLSLILGFLLAPIIQLSTSQYFDSFQQLGFLFIFCVVSFFIGLYYTIKFRYVDRITQQKKQDSMKGKKLKQEKSQRNEYKEFEGGIHVQSKLTQS